MLFPLIISFHYEEAPIYQHSYLMCIGLLLLIGALLSYFFRQQENNFSELDGFVITTLSWLLMSVFGGLPLIISGEIPNFIDATFEMMSGFTTTGASILTNVEALQFSSLFWRSFSHLIGGMGILVFFFAFAPQMGEGSNNILKAEMPGPEFGKLTSKNKSNAGILYLMYVVMTLLLILILMLAGLKPFDAAIHAFGAAGTGGFSNRALSVGYFNNPGVEYILAIAMIVFGVNFNLYFILLKRRVKDFIQDDELQTYLFIMALAVLLIMFNLFPRYQQGEELFRDSLFTVSTIMTTTGYATTDFGQWPLFSHLILLAVMFVGGMAGSTAGGIKVSRVLIYFKSCFRSIKQSIRPRQIFLIFKNLKRLDDNIVNRAYDYLGLYILIFFVCLLVVSVTQNDFLTSFSAVAATMNNIGPGFGVVGPTGSFATFSPIAKMTLTFAMLVGRLEIYPVLALFIPNIWNKNR